MDSYSAKILTFTIILLISNPLLAQKQNPEINTYHEIYKPSKVFVDGGELFTEDVINFEITYIYEDSTSNNLNFIQIDLEVNDSDPGDIIWIKDIVEDSNGCQAYIGYWNNKSQWVIRCDSWGRKTLKIGQTNKNDEGLVFFNLKEKD